LADKPHILVVDDEPGVRQLCCDVLRRSGYTAESAADAGAALRRLESGIGASGVDLVLTDIKMKPISGLAFLSAVRDLSPTQRVILMTGYPTLETAVEGMRLGALNYVTKPFTPSELRAAVATALDGWEPGSAGGPVGDVGEVEKLAGLVARSQVMLRLFAMVERVARTDATVLITGESGTGKELFARAIHHFSRRSDRVFVPVNCSALVDSLMESELFGHVKGAFTGATTQKSGLFQYADKGTLFLDEIGDLALGLQPKLLRVLQEGELKPVGGVRGVPVDVRIIAATHRDLEEGVTHGGFREDLFYRLNVFQLRIPPLRDRREDIEPLADAFLAEFAGRLGRGPLRLTPSAVHALHNHNWPGNVRELRNTLLRAATLAPTNELSAEDLMVMANGSGPQLPTGNGEYPFEDLPLEEVERRHILRTLERCKGNKSQTARILGINRTTLWKKLIRYGFEED
jgi:DNA-binding NtrC family response regulator